MPNESDAFVFASASLHGSGLSSGEPAWDRALAAGQLLPFVVESEDPANVRVVLGPLEPAEVEQWVGVVRGGLALPDGRLALCGGVAWILEKDTWADEYARLVAVPPGTYRATVYSYASAPNGRLCLEASGEEEPLGTWFRRTRPGEEMPAWLHNFCVNDPDLDPGHRQEWKRESWKGGPAVVDFLLHLEPVAALPRTEVGDGGFAEASECRKPARFPLGLIASGLTVDVDTPEEKHTPDPPPVFPALGSAAPVAVTGGSVTVPATKVVRLARLAWFCHPYTRPTLRLTFPGKAPKLEDVEGARMNAKGAEVVVLFDDDGQPSGGADALIALGKQLASVPEGATLELDLVRKSGGPLGAHRYKAVAETGAWRVTEASPVGDARQLTEALALMEALENGRRLSARDDDEAARIEAHVAKRLADYFGTNTLQRAGTEIALKRRDPVLFAQVVARVFWMRYAHTWPLQDDDASS